MRSNPGQCLTLYNILSVREAWPKASISTNIVKGFEVSGICPLNQEIFHDDDFAPAFVTDRQEVDTNNSASDEFKYKSDRYQTQNQDHSRLRVVKKRKCATLTDTPEKEAIKREQLQKTKKTKNNAVNGGKRKTKPSKKKTKPAESSNVEEYYCLFCLEPYSNSRPRETWIKCI